MNPQLPDATCARLANAIYDDDPAAWDHYDPGTDDLNVCWGFKRIDRFAVISLRGSKVFEDFVRDVYAIADPDTDDVLGPVSPGFLAGMRETWAKIKPLIRHGDDIVLTGHSLGAARARILCALMSLEGWPPVQCTTFGEPRPGFSKLAGIIVNIPGKSFRNGNSKDHDLVTDVPVSILSERYVHPKLLSLVCEPPTPDDVASLGVFAWHSMGRYEAATTT